MCTVNDLLLLVTVRVEEGPPSSDLSHTGTGMV